MQRRDAAHPPSRAVSPRRRLRRRRSHASLPPPSPPPANPPPDCGVQFSSCCYVATATSKWLATRDLLRVRVLTLWGRLRGRRRATEGCSSPAHPRHRRSRRPPLRHRPASSNPPPSAASVAAARTTTRATLVAARAAGRRHVRGHGPGVAFVRFRGRLRHGVRQRWPDVHDATTGLADRRVRAGPGNARRPLLHRRDRGDEQLQSVDQLGGASPDERVVLPLPTRLRELPLLGHLRRLPSLLCMPHPVSLRAASAAGAANLAAEPVAAALAAAQPVLDASGCPDWLRRQQPHLPSPRRHGRHAQATVPQPPRRLHRGRLGRPRSPVVVLRRHGHQRRPSGVRAALRDGVGVFNARTSTFASFDITPQSASTPTTSSTGAVTASDGRGAAAPRDGRRHLRPGGRV